MVPGGVLDTTYDEIIVANSNIDSITVYNGTDDGNVAPKRTISGALTGLNGPWAIALDTTNGEIIVANNDNDSVTVYRALQTTATYRR